MNTLPDTLEYCNACGGMGGCPGSDFGDVGWHPCFRCGATGLLLAGTAEREAALAAELPIPPGWYERGEADWMHDD